MRVRVQKWGNSLALRIPKVFASSAHVGQGSTVDVSLEKGRLIVTPEKTTEYSLDELLARVNKKNIHKEVSTGKAVGNEIW